MATTIPGIFNTGISGSVTDYQQLSFARMITRLMPNGTAPLFALTSYLKSETALQPEHGYFSKTAIFPSADVDTSNDILDNATTFPVVDAGEIIPGMIMRVNTTGENMLVTGVSGNDLTVVRGTGATTIANSTTGVRLYMVGNAYEEASTRPIALNLKPVRHSNYTQIFRNTWALSDTARATQVVAGDGNESESRQDCAALHAQAIEAALFFGKKSIGHLNGQPIRTMDGLLNIITTEASGNVHKAGGTTDFTTLNTYLDPVFDVTTDPKVGNERVLFAGGAAFSVLNNIGRLNSTYFMENGQTSFGLQFSTIKTTRGTFRIIEHPLFNSNVDWAKMAVAVDLSSINLAYLNGRQTQNREFNKDGRTAQDFGIDAVGGTLTTEVTLLVKNPHACAVITGLTAAARDS